MWADSNMPIITGEHLGPPQSRVSAEREGDGEIRPPRAGQNDVVTLWRAHAAIMQTLDVGWISAI